MQAQQSPTFRERCAASPPPVERKRHKRTLPYGAKMHKVEGLGVFAVQSVGNTSYSCGYHVALQLDGAEEPVRGYVAFKLSLREDGEFEWVNGAIEPTFCEWTDAHVREAEIIIEGLKHLDESGFMFQVHGCIEPLIRDHEREIAGQQRAIEHMDKLLADEREPKTIWVPKEQDPACKGFSRPRDPNNPSDQYEYDTRRTAWRLNRQRARDKLTTLTTGPALLRYELLKRLRWAYRRWSGADQEWVFPKSKRRKASRIKPKLLDLLDRARRNDIDVLDY